MDITDYAPAFASILVSLVGIVVFIDSALHAHDRTRRICAIVWAACMVYQLINRTLFIFHYPILDWIADIGRILTPIGQSAVSILETRRHR